MVQLDARALAAFQLHYRHNLPSIRWIGCLLAVFCVGPAGRDRTKHHLDENIDAMSIVYKMTSNVSPDVRKSGLGGLPFAFISLRASGKPFGLFFDVTRGYL